MVDGKENHWEDLKRERERERERGIRPTMKS